MANKIISIVISGKKYLAVYDYGSTFKLAEAWQVANFTKLSKVLVSFGFKPGAEPTFKQLNAIGEIIAAGIENKAEQDKKATDISRIAIMDDLTNNRITEAVLTDLMTAFTLSLPKDEKAESKGK